MKRELIERAREFRRAATPSEAILWAALRDSALGVRFRRQVVLGPFIADFVCHSLKLVVEVDGRVHENQRERDAERQRFIEAEEFTVFRVTADEVEHDLENVVMRLRSFLPANSVTPDE